MVIFLEGRIARLSAEQLDEHLTEQVHQGNVKVILDFTNVDFISSDALRILLGSIKNTRANGGDLFLANVSPMIQNILITTGLINLLNIFSDVDSALINF